jgi:anthranilate/para-aminobenzoate synthase component II
MAIRALILGFSVTDWENYDQEDLRELRQTVLAAQLPILGLCGGIQFIGLIHGVCLGPIRRLNKDEKDPSENYATGYFKEWGFTQLEIIKPDPLFDGLQNPSFLEVHYLELKEIPKGFELLASTNACRIQAIKQTGKLVYGLQFHPEAYMAEGANHQNWLVNLVYPDGYSEQHSDGRRLLINFFRLAGIKRGV